MSPIQGHPVVLAHGIARFDILREVRSNQLSAQINDILNSTGHSKVHIFAHSMGGLDARHMIVDIDGMADKVASLTTIGTPHLGTSLADALLTRGGVFLIEALRPVFHLEGFKNLTIAACAEFNRRAEGAEAKNGVVYRTYAATQERDSVLLPLQLSWQIIRAVEGENDGLVSLASQEWHKTLISGDGTSKAVEQNLFSVAADHLNEVGWWHLSELRLSFGLLPFIEQAENYERKIKDIYLEIARGL